MYNRLRDGMNVVSENGFRKLEISSINLADYLFFCAWFLFEATAVLDVSILVFQNSAFPTLMKLVRYLSYFLFLLSIYYKKIDDRKVVLAVSLVVIFVMSYVGSHDQIMVLYSLIFVAAIDIDADALLKVSTFVQGLFLLIFPALGHLDILRDYILVPEDRARHCLGFLYTTYPPILFFHFALALIYLKRDKLRLWFLLVLEMINFYFYIMTDTTMTFYTLSLFLFIIAVFHLGGDRGQILSKIKYGLLLYPFLMFALSLWLVVKYDPQIDWWNRFNEIVHSRIGLGKTGLEKYGIHILGNQIEWIGTGIHPKNLDKYNYVDSSYMQLLLNFGLLFIIAVLIIYATIMYKAIKLGDYLLIIILIAVMTLALSEPRLMNLTFNSFPLFVFAKLSKSRYSHKLT